MQRDPGQATARVECLRSLNQSCSSQPRVAKVRSVTASLLVASISSSGGPARAAKHAPYPTVRDAAHPSVCSPCQQTPTLPVCPLWSLPWPCCQVAGTGRAGGRCLPGCGSVRTNCLCLFLSGCLRSYTAFWRSWPHSWPSSLTVPITHVPEKGGTDGLGVGLRTKGKVTASSRKTPS